MIEWNNHDIPVYKQCELLGLSRSTAYYKPLPENPNKSLYKRLLDKKHTKHPFLGYRKLANHLKKLGHNIGEKKVRRLLREMGLTAIYPHKKTSIPNKEHKKYPYLLRGVEINRVNQVWSTDITYIPLQSGFVYLTAVIDWYSRFVLSWRLSNTIDSRFCVEALEEALKFGKPDIFNSDQGCQFTSEEFTGMLIDKGIRISMDGKGRALDNIFVERLWRTVKYEEVYLKDYQGPIEAEEGLEEYFNYYNYERPHQSLEYKTPDEVFKIALDKNKKVA
jgi:putative transposase